MIECTCDFQRITFQYSKQGSKPHFSPWLWNDAAPHTCCGPSFPRQGILVVSYDHLLRQWGLIALTSWPPPVLSTAIIPLCIVIRIIRVLERIHLQGSGPSDHIPTYFYPWDFIIRGGNPFPECIVHRHYMVLLMLIVLLLAILIFNQSNISFLVTCLKTSKS